MCVHGPCQACTDTHMCAHVGCRWCGHVGCTCIDAHARVYDSRGYYAWSMTALGHKLVVGIPSLSRSSAIVSSRAARSARSWTFSSFSRAISASAPWEKKIHIRAMEKRRSPHMCHGNKILQHGHTKPYTRAHAPITDAATWLGVRCWQYASQYAMAVCRRVQRQYGCMPCG